MRKPSPCDSSHVNCGSSGLESVKNNKIRKSFFDLSLPLIFSVWCLFLLFYAKLGLTHGNGGHSDDDSRSMPSHGFRNDNHCVQASSQVADRNGNHINGMLLELNVSMNRSNSTIHNHEPTNATHSLAVPNRLEVIVWNILGYTDLMCELQPHETQRKSKPGKQLNGRTQPTYLNLDEFRNITKQEQDLETPSRLVNVTHRLEPDGAEYNYASASKGAKVVAHNKEAKGASNILGKDHDKYLRNPCSVGGKFVVIELAEETLVDAVKIANFEHYSSNFKEFQLSGSLVYPTETWSVLGNFVAANVKHAQCFKLPDPKWVRYLKLSLLSHYGSEFYCTLSVLEVYGVDAIERMLEDLIVASGDSAASKLPNPNSTAMPSLKLESGFADHKKEGEIQHVVEAADKGVESLEDGQKLDGIKHPAAINTVPDPVMEVRHQPNGRIPGDSVLKILMQKVRSLELNLSVLEEYVKELNRRQGDVLPELDKELSRISSLLEKCTTDIMNLMEWKEAMDKGITDFGLWKVAVSSQLDALARENSILRLEVEKLVSDQASLENKELAVLAVSLSFAFLAILKLVSGQGLVLSGASMSEMAYQTSRGWVLILISSSVTIFVTLVCG